MVALRPPEDYARELLSRFPIEQPVNLETVASALGLHIRNVKSKGFEGALIRMPTRALGIVAVRVGIRGLGRERFTIAHEIGHYVLPGWNWRSSVCRTDGIESLIPSGTDQEIAANRFASELLLPANAVRAIVMERWPSTRTTKFIADRFKTSLTAAAIQCMVATDEACAVVVSIEGTVKFYKASRSWKHFIPVGGKLRKTSIANRLNFEDKEFSGMVPADSWTNSDKLIAGAEIFEDSIYLSPHNMTLTILTAKRL